MNDEEKTKEQLIQEIAELRNRCATLEITASEYKQLEAEIQNAREYAENIVETVREPLVVLNAELKILTANHRFYDTFKVTPDETTENFIYDLGNRQWDIPKLRELLETILPQKATFDNYEVEHDFATIGRRIMLLNARQIQRVLGKERIILLAIEDITERREIENGLEKARKELEATKISEDEAREYAESIINTVREPLISLDQNLRVVTASRSFYEFFKVKPEETVGHLIYDLGNKQWDIPKLRELLEDILPQKATFDNYEVEHDFTTIGRRIMLLNARQIQRVMGKERIILLAIEDITERKEIEAGLEKTRKELEIIKKTADEASEFAESVINTVREPLISLDQDLRVVTVSRSFYEFFKVKPEETVGQLIYDLGNRQWDIPKLRELLETILPQKATFDNYEVEHHFTTIGRRIMLLNARQIKRGKGKDRIILLAMEDITERKQLEAEIQDAREYAENIVETLREPLVVLNAELKILTANHRFYDTFKVTPEDTVGNFIYDLGNRQWDIPKLRVLFEAILPHNAMFNGYEVEHDFPGIGRKIILLNARQIFRKNIGSHIILLAMEDITERKLVEERISEVIRQQQAILNNIPSSAWLKDRKGTYVAVNDPFGKAVGKEPKDVVGKNVYDIYPREIAVIYEKNSRDAMASGTRTYFEESRIGREGKTQHMERIETPIFNDAGAVIGIIGIAHDITSRKEVEISLRHDSTHDVLTGLYNRAHYDEELERLVHDNMFPLSIVMADINGLKTINDTLGHEAGDNLIRMAARIILGAFRAEDIVARIGGDEFAVLLPRKDKQVAEEVVKRIMKCPEIVACQVSIAFGVGSAESKDQLAEALKQSDERMYVNKCDLKKIAYRDTGGAP